MAAQQALGNALIAQSIQYYYTFNIDDPEANTQLDLLNTARVHPIWHANVRNLTMQYTHSKPLIRWIFRTLPYLQDNRVRAELHTRLGSIKSLVISGLNLPELQLFNRPMFRQLDTLFIESLSHIFAVNNLLLCAPQLRRCRINCSIIQYPASLRFLMGCAHLQELIVRHCHGVPNHNHTLVHNVLRALGPRLRSVKLLCHAWCFRLDNHLMDTLAFMPRLDRLEMSCPIQTRTQLHTAPLRRLLRLTSLTCSVRDKDAFWQFLEATPNLATIKMSISKDFRSGSISSLKLVRRTLKYVHIDIDHNENEWNDSYHSIRTFLDLSEVFDVLENCNLLEHLILKIDVEKKQYELWEPDRFTAKLRETFQLHHYLPVTHLQLPLLQTLHIDVRSVAKISGLTTSTLCALSQAASNLRRLFLHGSFDLTAFRRDTLFPELRRLVLHFIEQDEDEIDWEYLKRFAPRLEWFSGTCINKILYAPWDFSKALGIEGETDVQVSVLESLFVERSSVQKL